MGLVFSSIFWALAHPCPLRNPKDWQGGKTEAAASYSQAVRDAPTRTLKPDQIYDDIRVRSWDTLEQPKRWMYPASGYSLNREYATVGGLEGLRMLCGSCPACTTSEPAGCTGDFIGEQPDEFDEIVDSLGLRAELGRHFPATTPHWYGLWIEPVIPPAGISVVRQLLGALETRNQRRAEGYSSFLRALEVAERNGMMLHVQRTPGGTLGGPGPHCPRCTALQDIGEEIVCTVCGHVCSTKLSKWRFPRRQRRRDDLFTQLGERRFAEITRLSLISQGALDTELDFLVAAILERERTRPVWEAEQERADKAATERQKRQDRYKRVVLYEGIPRKGDQFRASAFRRLLERYVVLGVEVTDVSHCAEEFVNYRVAYRGEDPFEMLDKWLAEGLCEWFRASVSVPDALLYPQPGTGFAAEE